MAKTPPIDREAYAADIQRRMREHITCDKTQELHNALNDSAVALEKLAAHMASIDYAKENPCKVCKRSGLSAEAGGKTSAYIAKVVNEIYRLLEYAKGNADARVEHVGLEKLLEHLSQDQFGQVCKWIEEAQATKAPTLQ